MKYIYILLTIIILSATAQADIKGNLYMEATKAVNGGQAFGLPVLELELTKTPLLIDVEFRNNFTSPRGNMKSFPNHLSSMMSLHFGYKSKTGTWITFSLNTEYVYAGNDFGRPEGLEFSNSLRYGIEF